MPPAKAVEAMAKASKLAGKKVNRRFILVSLGLS
jgi:hypothetical protein